MCPARSPCRARPVEIFCLKRRGTIGVSVETNIIFRPVIKYRVGGVVSTAVHLFYWNASPLKQQRHWERNQLLVSWHLLHKTTTLILGVWVFWRCKKPFGVKGTCLTTPECLSWRKRTVYSSIGCFIEGSFSLETFFTTQHESDFTAWVTFSHVIFCNGTRLWFRLSMLWRSPSYCHIGETR
jgi:hypothetical protein